MRGQIVTRRIGYAAAALSILGFAGCTGSSTTSGPNNSQLFLRSAVESADHSTVALPIFKGTSQGGDVWYVITDSSSQSDAAIRGVNFSPKLANAKGTTAVQIVTVNGGVIDFPATVNFGQTRILTAGSPAPFPPAQATPGATGQSGYSPLIQMPDGTVLNASHVINSSGHADKIVSSNTSSATPTITYKETTGFFANRTVHYISLDASAATSATIEDVTLATALGSAPTVNDETSASARETIIAFTNGQTGASNPERQGLGATILDGMVPFNIIDAVPPTTNGPGSTAYSPLWDVSLATWSAAAVTAGQNVHQTSVTAVRTLAAAGTITAPSGAAFGGSGPVANCPVVSLEAVK